MWVCACGCFFFFVWRVREIVRVRGRDAYMCVCVFRRGKKWLGKERAKSAGQNQPHHERERREERGELFSCSFRFFCTHALAIRTPLPNPGHAPGGTCKTENERKRKDSTFKRI